jgi:hypothetical protein
MIKSSGFKNYSVNASRENGRRWIPATWNNWGSRNPHSPYSYSSSISGTFHLIPSIRNAEADSRAVFRSNQGRPFSGYSRHVIINRVFNLRG